VAKAGLGGTYRANRKEVPVPRRYRVPPNVLGAISALGVPFVGRGIAQYTSAEFDAFTAKNRIRRSLGRTGVCWDNAAAESFFATLKNETYYRQTFHTRARARFAVAEYIEVFYNRRRLHSTLGYRTPFEALTDYRAAATDAA
jgi:transposase InsO family protein